MITAREIIAMWPSPTVLARKLGENPVVVRRWRSRNSIPAIYDVRLVDLAKADGKPITYEILALSRHPGHGYQNGPDADESQDGEAA